MAESDASGEALVGNAADRKQVDKAGKAEKANARSLESAWKRVMATNDALLVFGELLTRFGAFATPFDSNSNTMAFKVGEQNVAHYLMAKINSARPDALPKMMPGKPKETDNG
jgi:hypothetical protein